MSAAHLSKAERLQIAGQTAPALRSAKHRRPVKVIDAEGNVVREIGSVQLAKSIHERAGIEFDVGTDPKSQGVCPGHEGPCPHQARPPASALSDRAIRLREGRLWQCRTCRTRRVQAEMTPEQREAQKARMRRAAASRTPEQMRAAGKKGAAALLSRPDAKEICRNSMTPEQRSAHGRKANAAMSPEARARATSILQNLTPEQRRRGRAKQQETMGKAGKTLAGDKAWDTMVARGKRKPWGPSHCAEPGCEIIVSGPGKRCQPHAQKAWRRERRGGPT